MADDIDAATAIAILRLQIQDLYILEGLQHTYGDTTDGDLSLRLQREELGRRAEILEDRLLALQFGESPLTNDHLLPLPPGAIPQVGRPRQVSISNPSNPSTSGLTDASYESAQEEPSKQSTDSTEHEPASIPTDNEQDPSAIAETPGTTRSESHQGSCSASPPQPYNVVEEAEHSTKPVTDTQATDAPLIRRFQSQRSTQDVTEETGYPSNEEPAETGTDQSESSSNEEHQSQDPVHGIINGSETSSTRVLAEAETEQSVSLDNPIDTFIVEVDCLGCDDEVSQKGYLHLGCGHDYCPECLVNLFGMAMKDDSLYPPRCCGQLIPLRDIQEHFPIEFPDAFQRRRLEVDTANPTYYSNKDCAYFIDPWNIEEDNAACPECFTQTCTICKNGEHEGVCPQDTAAVALDVLAVAEGWKRCPSCKIPVDLTYGCNHMRYVSTYSW
ncbi:MAG: hypothetical protein Q9226_001738 [Calogaya cf. arnoldii]